MVPGLQDDPTLRIDAGLRADFAERLGGNMVAKRGFADFTELLTY